MTLGEAGTVMHKKISSSEEIFLCALFLYARTLTFLMHFVRPNRAFKKVSVRV